MNREELREKAWEAYCDGIPDEETDGYGAVTVKGEIAAVDAVIRVVLEAASDAVMASVANETSACQKRVNDAIRSLLPEDQS